MQTNRKKDREVPIKQLHRSRTSVSLSQLIKTTKNITTALPKQFPSQSRTQVRITKSRGNLRMGSVAKPAVILTKQARKNPFHTVNGLTQKLLNQKGLCQLVSMGVINKQADYYELLNLRYQVQPKPVDEVNTFLTNPAILINTYYQATKQQESQQPTIRQSEKVDKRQSRQKSKRMRSSKKKVVKKQDPIFVINDQVRLNVINGYFEKNESYHDYVKNHRRKGTEVIFKLFANKVQQFAKKYQLRKFTIVPAMNQTKRLTQADIVRCIQNAKLLGIRRKLKGTNRQILANLVVMKVQKIRFKNLRIAVQRLQKVKARFKIKKFYRQMLNRRWEYLTFKLGAFAQSQRRAMEKQFRPEVQVHIIASDFRDREVNTYYKWEERSMAHLMRLYNNEVDHLVLIHNQKIDVTEWLQEIEQMPSSWKKPTVLLIEASLESKDLQECAQIYFGLRPADIKKIKRLCSGKKSVLIPNSVSKYLPLLSQALGIEMMAGTFTSASTSILFEEETNPKVEQSSNVQLKFKKLQVNSLQMTNYYRKRLGQIQLANSVYQSKTNVKRMFASLKLPSPLSLSIQGINQREFFKQFVRMILRYKDQSKWVLKLPNSTFSRGLALFEIDSLKIIKQSKKKANISEQQIDHIAKIMQYIMVQKVTIPHNSLLSGQEFMGCFKETGGYIQAYLEGYDSVSVFGRIQFNGVFSLLGSYRKYYAQNVSFGAMYPGIQITSDLKNKIAAIANRLYSHNIFGYLTVEMLVNQKTGELYFIDLVPHLEVYSELYFFYKRLLDINQVEGNVTTLTRKLFYCPFIDNNGNITPSFQQFQQLMINKKVKFDQALKIGTRFFQLKPGSADVLAMVVVGQDEPWVLKEVLQGLNEIVEAGKEFKKFAKGAKVGQCDGLYILDIIWKLRQLKKQLQ